MAQSLQMAPATGSGGVPSANAVRVAEAPTLDGDVLGDPIWQQAPAFEGFKQFQPNEGQPVSERTEVRIMFTKDTLFVGVVCYDSDPDGIIVSDSRRDSSLDNTDSFRMILDTFRDRQNGFVFGTNPAGLEYDGQVTNEGQGGGGLAGATQQSGSGGGFNLNWDGAWVVRTRTTEIGWTAEFAIPFKTLRFPGGRRSGVGRQLPAQHPPQERGSVLGPDSSPVQPLSRLDRRLDCRAAAAGVPQLQADSLRARPGTSRAARTRWTA